MDVEGQSNQNEVISPVTDVPTGQEPVGQQAQPTSPTPNDTVNEKTNDNGRNLPSIFSWEASEYISHSHGFMWYVAVIGVTAALVALLVFVLGEWLSAVVVVLMAIALVVYAHRPPRTLRYSLNEAGITIGQKFYPYAQFRSFALIPDHALLTVELDPMQRFMPRISMFIDNRDADMVADTLEQRLPRTERKADVVDRISHKLKF